MTARLPATRLTSDEMSWASDISALRHSPKVFTPKAVERIVEARVAAVEAKIAAMGAKFRSLAGEYESGEFSIIECGEEINAALDTFGVPR